MCVAGSRSSSVGCCIICGFNQAVWWALQLLSGVNHAVTGYLVSAGTWAVVVVQIAPCSAAASFAGVCILDRHCNVLN
jgi:hypothetical protein